ncbi:MAG: acylneuraminate cytidylyltransferase, partial [Gemmatimonadota bacterium]|nr:acylneuraminate cytidylyltransferase [Gemmatimonadota bacterium]
PQSFRLGSLSDGVDRHELRWTVDTLADIEFARCVIERLGGGNEYSWRDVVELVSREPALSSLNAHVTPKPVIEG